ILPPDGSYFEWTNSGNLDVSGFDGEQVYIAFVYESTTEEAATWEVDNIELVGEGEYIPSPEPTNYPASFTAEANALSIELNWTDATGTVIPTGYLIKASAEDNIMVPEDFVPVDSDPDLSDGTGAMNVAEGVGSYTFSGLLENTAYYFKIFPYTNTGEYIDYKTDGTVPSATATTTEDNTVDIMFTTFDESWEEWTAINITGDQVWDRDNTFGIDGTPCAKMSGYEGTTFENEDWLISPMLDLSDYKNEKISFFNAYSYNGIALEFKISMDYDGGGSPKDFTWTNLTGEVIWSGGFFSWTESGEVDISSYAENTCYVAFVFQCTATESSTWEIDNILLKGEEDTGIEENIEENTFMIYPNPNNGTFTLVNSANFDRIEIYSVTGSQIFTSRVNSENMQFAIPELNKGIYYIRLIDEQKNTIFSKPLIIQ
nr:DUF5017 domain-containing protein [Bacteroidota bacterium]